jgi:hypothetical protein
VHMWTGPLFVLQRLRAPQVPAAAATWADVTVVRLLRLLPSRAAADGWNRARVRSVESWQIGTR